MRIRYIILFCYFLVTISPSTLSAYSDDFKNIFDSINDFDDQQKREQWIKSASEFVNKSTTMGENGLEEISIIVHSLCLKIRFNFQERKDSITFINNIILDSGKAIDWSFVFSEPISNEKFNDTTYSEKYRTQYYRRIPYEKMVGFLTDLLKYGRTHYNLSDNFILQATKDVHLVTTQEILSLKPVNKKEIDDSLKKLHSKFNSAEFTPKNEHSDSLPKK